MWLDSSVGLYYVRARVYDASVGRFLSNDPAEGWRTRPEGFELSRFVHGNPFSGQDPTGLFEGTASGTTTAAAVAANIVQAGIASMNFVLAVRGARSAAACMSGVGPCTDEDLRNMLMGGLAGAALFGPVLLGAAVAGLGVVGTAGRSATLFHYTSSAGRSGIVGSQSMNASTGAIHARHGAGVYFTDIAPQAVGGSTAGTRSRGRGKELG
jgi:RHS repeat-associated protein